MYEEALKQEIEKLKSQLKQTEEKHSFIFENTNQAIVYHNVTGEIIEANLAAQKILGLTLDQMKGLTSIDPRWRSIHEDGSDFPGHTHPISETIRTGLPIKNVKMGVFNPIDNKYKWININSLPKYSPVNGLLNYIVVVFEDITELHNKNIELQRTKETTESAKANLTAIIESIQDSIWAINRNYEIIYVNNTFKQEFFQSFGITLLPGTNLLNMLPDSIKELWKLRYEKAFNNEIYIFEDEVQTINGTVYIYVAVYPIIHNNQVIGASFFGNNITKRKLAEIQLQDALKQAAENEAKYRSLYVLLRLMTDTMPDMIWAKDLEQKYIFANRAMCNKLLNANNLTEPIGKTDMFFAQRERDMHPENPKYHTFGEVCANTDEITLQQMREMQFDEYGNVKGKFVYLDVHKAPLFNAENKLIGVVGSARDITEGKKIEENLKHAKETYLNIFNSVSEAIYIFDFNKKIIDVNKAVEKIYGQTSDHFIGLTPFVFEAKGLNNWELIMQKVKELIATGKSARFDFWATRKNGEIFPNEVIIHLSTYFGNKVLIAVARDITERKRNEQELITAKEIAEENSRLKSSFLQNMSHEIRTPLNAICGFSDLLNDPEITNERRKNYTAIIQESSTQLLSVVSDVLTISALETNQEKISITTVNINDILQEQFELFKNKAYTKKIAFYKKCSLPDSKAIILTDKFKLSQILANLISNALKFTNHGFIEFGYYINYEKTEYSIQFYVKDTGIGISPEHQEKIFERFVQADAIIQTNFGGTGLGLAICKGLITLLNGTIQVKSDLGEGSIFYFNLPINTEGLENKIISLTNEELQKPAILIAEYEQFNYMYTVEMLSEFQGSILHAVSGKQAIELCSSHNNIGLIIMDIKMPDSDGYSVASRMKELLPDTPILVLSASVLESEMELNKHIFSRYLTKPIGKKDFLQTIEKYIQIK